MSACTTPFDAHREHLDSLHAAGRYDIAAQALDDPEVKSRYGDKNVLLYWLDRGAVALASGDPQAALAWFERAESYMETRREPTAGEGFAQWLINDTTAPYYGSSYEELYVNVFKLLANLELGRIGGGATVEARRMAGKADVLRDRYIRTEQAVEQRQDARARASMGQASRFVDVNSGGQFLDSTLGNFLTAVTFMKDGDRENQRVAARRLASAIQLQNNLQPGVSADSFGTLGDTPPDAVNVLYVALSGRGPTKVPERIGPIPIYQWPLYFELPVLRGGSEETASVRVIAADPGASAISPAGAPMAKVEDMRAVATENFDRELPQIYARTLIRSSAKAAVSFAATEAVKNEAGGCDSENLAQFGMILAGLAFVALTEKADLRSWVFLPARADAVLLKLPPGRHNLRAEFLAPDGSVLHQGPWREVEIPASIGPDTGRQLVTVVEHFWR